MKPSVKCEKTSQHGFSGNKLKGDKHIAVTIKDVRYVRKKDCHVIQDSYNNKMGKELVWLFELAQFRYVNQ